MKKFIIYYIINYTVILLQINMFKAKQQFSLNLINIKCPYTLVKIKKITSIMKYGETLLIKTNNHLVITDIQVFCEFMKFNMIKKITNKSPYVCIIKKI
ncbi:hypothetical protein GJT87_00145 [Enterobacteriaceae endosymbiont of Macroplea mutica]|uniref:sulfurtransferase TusA family protein n=1 Tax=Enterobacteriaceae endosymbiont of Macroplea mutica TaxID=2675791 RepID=UPI00144A0C9E|nr:hypothetical protein GJT87_00145 [Enterobacteriaceae endosymbiont of Macroplea mutica]